MFQFEGAIYKVTITKSHHQRFKKKYIFNFLPVFYQHLSTFKTPKQTEPAATMICGVNCNHMQLLNY